MVRKNSPSEAGIKKSYFEKWNALNPEKNTARRSECYDGLLFPPEQ